MLDMPTHMDLIAVTTRGKSGQIRIHIHTKIHTQKEKEVGKKGKRKWVGGGKKTRKEQKKKNRKKKKKGRKNQGKERGGGVGLGGESSKGTEESRTSYQ